MITSVARHFQSTSGPLQAHGFEHASAGATRVGMNYNTAQSSAYSCRIGRNRNVVVREACACLALVAALLFVTELRAEIKPNSLFTDNMVLQRERPVRVWGTAADGEKVKVDHRRSIGGGGSKGRQVAGRA